MPFAVLFFVGISLLLLGATLYVICRIGLQRQAVVGGWEERVATSPAPRAVSRAPESEEKVLENPQASLAASDIPAPPPTEPLPAPRKVESPAPAPIAPPPRERARQKAAAPSPAPAEIAPPPRKTVQRTGKPASDRAALPKPPPPASITADEGEIPVLKTARAARSGGRAKKVVTAPARRGSGRGAESSKPPPPPEHPAVASARTASVHAGVAGLSPELAQAWRGLSILAESGDCPAVAAIWDLESEPALAWLYALKRVALVVQDGQGVGARFRLSPEAREVATAQLARTGEEVSAIGQRHARHYRAVLASATSDFLAGGAAAEKARAIYERERTNIEAAWNWAYQTALAYEIPLSDDAKSAEAGMRLRPPAEMPDPAYALAVSLLRDYVVRGFDLLEEGQHPLETIVWLEAALAAAQALGDERAARQIEAHLATSRAACGGTESDPDAG